MICNNFFHSFGLPKVFAMKIKINTNLIINIIVIGFLSLVIFTWSVFYFHIGYGGTQRGTDTAFVSRNSYRWIDTTKPIDNDSLINSMEDMAYKYRKLKDSIKLTREMKNGELFQGSYASFSPLLGTYVGLSCDTCSIKWYWSKGLFSNNRDQFYISLFGWKIKNSKWGAVNYDDSVVFHVEHGQSYIRKEMRFPKAHTAAVVDAPVKFRYNTQDDYLMIPVSRSTKHVMDIVLIVIVLIFFAGILYLIAGFLKLMVDLLKGLFFTNRNIRRLKLIAFSLLIYPCAIFLLNLLLRLIFASYFTPDVKLSKAVWEDSWKQIGIGLIFFALYRAFKQGKKLKEEQELTI